jgi:hypothetical protein
MSSTSTPARIRGCSLDTTVRTLAPKSHPSWLERCHDSKVQPKPNHDGTPSPHPLLFVLLPSALPILSGWPLHLSSVVFVHDLSQDCVPRLERVDVGALVPLPALKTRCGGGFGMAACPALGLLVTSNHNDNTLSMFALPHSSGAGTGAGAGLALVCTLGGAGSPAPMQFQFNDGDYLYSGWMAFTGPTTSRLLLVTDAGDDAVHIIGVAGRVHAGYVAAPGTIAGPRGVAARGSLVAVSAWIKRGSGDHVVRVFEGSGASWTAVRVVAGGFGAPGSADGQLHRPYGLRFTGDGMGLAVADPSNHRVSLFRVEDGSFVRHVATGLSYPLDVEECEGGWLVACDISHTIEFVDGGGVGRARMGSKDCGDGVFGCPSALALVPSLGLVVRGTANGGRVQVFSTPDAIAMASMSAPRVAWMVAVARGRVFREQGRQRARDAPTCKRPSRRGHAGPGANLKQ